MSNLLTVSRVPKKNLPEKAKLLAIECEVSPKSAPYLVTTSTGLTWVRACSAKGSISAAVRLDTHPDQFFLDCVESIHLAGLKLGWGNIHPLSREGFTAAIAHVQSYDLGDVEILVPTAVKGPEILNMVSHSDVPTKTCSWLTSDLAVVVPRDRGFVGMVYRVTAKDMIGLLHNAARGVAIVSNRQPQEVHPNDESNVAE